MVAVRVRTGLEHPVRDADGMTGGHQHRHGLTHRAADAEHHGGEQAVARRRQQHPEDHLPARAAQGNGRFTIGIGNRLEGILADRDDDRHTLSARIIAPLNILRPIGALKSRTIRRVHDGQAGMNPHTTEEWRREVR